MCFECFIKNKKYKEKIAENRNKECVHDHTTNLFYHNSKINMHNKLLILSKGLFTVILTFSFDRDGEFFHSTSYA